MSNAFKAPGSSRANKQQHNNLAVATGAMPLYSGYANFLQGMQPMMNQAYGNLFNMGTHDNTNAMVDAMRQHALLNGLQANHAAMNMYGNGSLAQGMGINAMNKGIDASNAYMAQQYDPATLVSHLATTLGAMQTPLQNMSSLAATIYNQPQVTPGKDFLGQLGDLSEIAKNVGYQPGTNW